MRQLFTESTMLALAGGAVGLLVAFWGLAAITKLLPVDFPRLNEIRMDWRILRFTLSRQCSPEYFLVLPPRCKSRGLTFRNRLEKPDEERREVVGKVAFAMRLS